MFAIQQWDIVRAGYRTSMLSWQRLNSLGTIAFRKMSLASRGTGKASVKSILSLFSFLPPELL